MGTHTVELSRRLRRGRVVGWSLRLTIADTFPDEREWRDLRGRLRAVLATPSAVGVLEGRPMDPRLAGLIAARPARPANQRAGGRGQLKAYWEALRRAAHATPGLAGRWQDWKALRRYVERCERREQENREALERFDAEWSAVQRLNKSAVRRRLTKQRDTASGRGGPGRRAGGQRG